jgi:hypothetical protein
LHGKRPTGFGEKPHDYWAVPLNRKCHTAQHAFGDEMLWWSQHGIDPFKTCMRYYNAWLADPDEKHTEMRERKPRKIRRLKDSENDHYGSMKLWPSRKIPSRKFQTGKK